MGRACSSKAEEKIKEEGCQSERCDQKASHVVGNVDRVQLVAKETVPQVHALFLAARIDENGAGIHDHHDADNQVVLLENSGGYQWHQVESLPSRGESTQDWFSLKNAVAFASGHRLAARRYFVAPPSSDVADSEATDNCTFFRYR